MAKKLFDNDNEYRPPDLLDPNLAPNPDINHSPQLHEKLFREGDVPDVLILATSSWRKLLMFMIYVQFGGDFTKIESLIRDGKKNGSLIDKTNPLSLQLFWDEHVSNGDGKLKEKVFLGYFYGVPVWAVPQTGETKNNDPEAEAKNKLLSVINGLPNNLYLLIVSIDTVEAAGGKQLGKVANDPAYAPFVSELIGDPILDKEFINFFTTIYGAVFFDEHFPANSQAVHESGIGLTRIKGNDIAPPVTKTFRLIQEVTDVRSSRMRILDVNIGGAGASQQLIDDWTRTSDLLEIIEDEAVRKRIARLAPKDIPWAVYCQITGMPFFAIEEFISQQAANGPVSC